MTFHAIWERQNEEYDFYKEWEFLATESVNNQRYLAGEGRK